MTQEEVKELLGSLKGDARYKAYFDNLNYLDASKLLKRWIKMLANVNIEDVELGEHKHLIPYQDAKMLWHHTEVYEPFPIVAGFDSKGNEIPCVTRDEVMAKIAKLRGTI